MVFCVNPDTCDNVKKVRGNQTGFQFNFQFGISTYLARAKDVGPDMLVSLTNCSVSMV